jgi:endoglucanase
MTGESACGWSTLFIIFGQHSTIGARPYGVLRRRLLLLMLMPLGSACDSPAPNALLVLHNGDASTPYVSPKSCSAGQVWTRNGCTAQADIKVNTVGYLPSRAKFATVPADGAQGSFVIRDLATGQIAYAGALSENPVDVPDTGETVRLADFTALSAPGSYVAEVAGFATSPQFEIATSAYDEVLRVSLLGLYGQRCGAAVSIDYGGDTFTHGACHPTDGAFDPAFIAGTSGTKDATGGWHDAGDYGKYTVNGAFSVAFLLKAWEDFGEPLRRIDHLSGGGGALPPILAEAKYQLDWLLRMQQADGSVLHLVCPKSYPSDTVSPDDDRAPRYFLQASTSATAYFTAALAAATRVFRACDPAYSDQLLAAAQFAESWLDANTDAISAADGRSNSPYVAGGPYNVGLDGDAAARDWAKLELWRTTGDGDLPTIESKLEGMTVAGSWDWAGAENFAVFDYAASDSPTRSTQTVATVQAAIVGAADVLASRAQNHGYGRGLAANDYNWGSNGMVARSVMNLWAAYRITTGSKYLDAATLQVDYLLGRNPFGRSFLTGVGFAPPTNPHHRPSNADNLLVPWPGLLVGGAHKDSGDPKAKTDSEVPVGKFWFDVTGDYYVNEIAINWNAALIYALAGFVQ